MFGIDEILLLHLTRSAPSLLNVDNKAVDSENQSQFAMFDYFDWLTVERSDRLDHLACMGLAPVEATAVPLSSSQYLTLVTLQRQPKPCVQLSGWGVGDPFFHVDRLDLPFLSVMMVTVLPSCNSGVSAGTETDVGEFLLSCIAQLQELVDHTCSEFFAQDGEEGTPLHAVYQVYHSVNSSNFCIAVRSRIPELTYHISMRIRASQLNMEAAHGFPPLDCDTFSLVGVYCPVGQEPHTWMPPESVRKISPSKVALRLSVTNQVRNELSQNHRGSVIEDLCGLYGRYDVTLHMDLEKFWQLYPWICAHKLGTKCLAVPPAQKPDPLISLLKRALENQGAQCINIRLLLDLTGGEAPSDTGERQRKRQERVQKENLDVTRQLQKIEGLVSQLPSFQMEYWECLRLLQDLWESYNSLRYQEDSFINGNILLTQVCLLMEIICCYIESIADIEVPIYYEDLVGNLKRAINGISHFQKLMLSINQQSIQSPNYEIQMHTDLEKFVVAYTEFCRRFLTEHLHSPAAEDGNLKSRQQRIFPIITVDIVHNSIQATPLFLLPYHVLSGGELMETNPQMERLLLSIEMPDINAFGSIYTTLPLICHELFHNFRVMDRDTRNDVLERFLMYRVAQYVVRRWIARAGEQSNYVPFGELENKLFVEKLAEQLDIAYHKRCGTVHKTANIGVLLSNILIFLTEDVFTSREENEFQRPMESPQHISDILGQLCRLALDASETETPEWAKDYETMRLKLKRGKALDELDKELAPLVRNLVYTVLRGYITRVMEMGIELLNLGLEKDLETQIRTCLLSICAMASEPPKNFPTAIKADEIDHCIQEIDEKRREIAAACRSLRASGVLPAKALDFAICELCRAMKDTSHLVAILGSCQYQQNKRHQDNRDRLLMDYHAAIRTAVQACHDGSSADWLIFSAPQIQALLAPLGGDIQQDEPFVKELRQVFFNCSQKDIVATVKASTTLYREVFADLGMCISLHLNSFGYLHVLAHSGIFENLEEQPFNMKLERMLLVSWVLLCQTDTDAALQKLWEDTYTFFKQITALVGVCEDPEWKRFYGRLDALLQHKITISGVPAYHYTVETVKKWVEDAPDFQKMYCQLKYLWNMIHLASYLEKALDSIQRHPLKDHFMELNKLISQRWSSEQNSSDYEVLVRVGCAYNDPQHTDLFMSGQEAFQDTLKFVLHEYYLGWTVYGQEFQQSENIESWLNSLIGGGAPVERILP